MFWYIVLGVCVGVPMGMFLFSLLSMAVDSEIEELDEVMFKKRMFERQGDRYASSDGRVQGGAAIGHRRGDSTTAQDFAGGQGA